MRLGERGERREEKGGEKRKKKRESGSRSYRHSRCNTSIISTIKKG